MSGQKHDQGKRGTVLLEAMDVINGERQDSYGNPEDSHQLIAEFWDSYVSRLPRCADGEPIITARAVAEMLVLMEIARMQGQKPHRDNYRDAAGYIGIAADMVEDTLADTEPPLLGGADCCSKCAVFTQCCASLLVTKDGNGCYRFIPRDGAK